MKVEYRQKKWYGGNEICVKWKGGYRRQNAAHGEVDNAANRHMRESRVTVKRHTA